MIAEQLKKAVLQAAIQGKLTEQLSEDGDARDLLKEIQKEKARLVKEGKLKKEKPLPEITDDEISFDIPENWVWARLGDITDYGVGRQVHPKYIPLNSWILELEDIEKDKFKVTAKRRDRIAGSSKNYFLPGDVLYGKLRPYLRKVIVADELGFCSTEIVPFNSFGCINRQYFKFYMVSPLLDFHINNITHGMDMPRLGTDKAKKLLVSIPPLAEQQRIVEKLDQVLREIENLVLDENKLDELEKAFPKKMKDAILQAAIQGKLTEQRPEDGDARNLLKDIHKEKGRLIKEGKLKKDKPLPEISEDEIPFDIPENWVWVRLGEIGSIVGGGTPKTENSEYWQNGSIPWLTPADMKYINGKFVEKGSRFITFQGLSKSSAQILPKGSVVFSSRAPIGYVAIANNQLSTNQGFKSVVPYLHGFSEYIYYFLLGNKNEIEQLGSGTTFKEVSGSVVEKILIPLPPLAEQERIVEKLDQVLPLLDRLE